MDEKRAMKGWENVDPLGFFRLHVVDLDLIKLTGKCPLCGTGEFSVYREGGFECQRCGLGGGGIKPGAI
jgi:tRNA(Ile2) C34 agmatinyltransferase TiaS